MENNNQIRGIKHYLTAIAELIIETEYSMNH